MHCHFLERMQRECVAAMADVEFFLILKLFYEFKMLTKENFRGFMEFDAYENVQVYNIRTLT